MHQHDEDNAGVDPGAVESDHGGPESQDSEAYDLHVDVRAIGLNKDGDKFSVKTAPKKFTLHLEVGVSKLSLVDHPHDNRQVACMSAVNLRDAVTRGLAAKATDLINKIKSSMEREETLIGNKTLADINPTGPFFNLFAGQTMMALRALVALLLVGRPLSSSNLILSMYAWRAVLVNTSCLFGSNTEAQEGYWRDKSPKFSFHMCNSPFMSFFCVTGSSWLPVNG